MINKNWLKFSLLIPVYGTLVNIKYLHQMYVAQKKFPYSKLLGAAFIPTFTFMIVGTIIDVIVIRITSSMGIDGSLIAVLAILVVGGAIMNLVFYLYYKKSFAKYDNQNQNNQGNDTQK
mgnify:CR=1 FL=1